MYTNSIVCKNTHVHVLQNTPEMDKAQNSHFRSNYCHIPMCVCESQWHHPFCPSMREHVFLWYFLRIFVHALKLHVLEIITRVPNRIGFKSTFPSSYMHLSVLGYHSSTKPYRVLKHQNPQGILLRSKSLFLGCALFGDDIFHSPSIFSTINILLTTCLKEAHNYTSQTKIKHQECWHDLCTRV
jgi:hypothetical protein